MAKIRGTPTMPPVPGTQVSPYAGGVQAISTDAPPSQPAFRSWHQGRAPPQWGDPIIPLRDAAALVGCHPDTLKNQARKGKLTLIKVSTRRIGVRQSEFDRFLNNCVWSSA
jgi:hypothetical protein